MNFHPMKCFHLRVSKKRRPLETSYTMLDHTLEKVDHYPYLGVEISSDLNWNHHVAKMAGKAQRALGFIRRNLYNTPQQIKVQMYQALIRPHLEYCSSAWDPYTDKNISQIEMIQRRAARFVTGIYSREPGTVTKIMDDLEWPTLQQRRKVSRLGLLYKTINNEVAIDLPEYIQRHARNTRQTHDQTFLQVRSRTKVHQNSFFPRTIKEWNDLPPDILTVGTASQFRTAVSSYIH